MGDKMETKNRKKSQINYNCNNCDYTTSNKFDYNKHLLTAKHLKVTLGDPKVAKNRNYNLNHICSNCNKVYVSRNGLWKHKKSCDTKNCKETNDTNQFELFTEVIKTTVIELMKNGCNNINNNITNNNINTNSHNKTFNLNFYLNETCKDAINIDDFVKSIKLQLDDLENTGRVGYVNGISDIINNNLNSMNSHTRPIHCTDEKREVLYIKNEGEWVKESDTKPILTNAIKTIANKNIQVISEWKKVNPDCTDVNSKKNNFYLKIVSNSMPGISREECEKNYNKIIKNIVKENIVDKKEFS
jgi:hypothetical protein